MRTRESRPAEAAPESSTKTTASKSTALVNPVSWSEVLDHVGAAWQAGHDAGMDRGRQLADEEAAALHREAVRVVHAMAKLDPWDDVQAGRRQRQAEAADRHAMKSTSWPDEVSA